MLLPSAAVIHQQQQQSGLKGAPKEALSFSLGASPPLPLLPPQAKEQKYIRQIPVGHEDGSGGSHHRQEKQSEVKMLGNESSDLSVHCPATTAAADADPTESSFEFWTEFAALLAVAAFGLVCNTLAVPILLTRQVSSSLFNRTLVFLAAFDNVYLLCEMTESVRQYLGPAAGEWHVRLFPHLLYPLQNIALVGSIYTTVVVALQRYRAVDRPVDAYMRGNNSDDIKWDKRMILVHVVPVLIFSIVFNLPTFFEFYATDQEEGLCPGSGLRICASKLRTDRDYVFYYRNLARTPVTGLLPLASLCVLNYLVYMGLVRRRKMIQIIASHSPFRRQLRVENRQARTLFGVALLFVTGHLLRIGLNLHELLVFQEEGNVVVVCPLQQQQHPQWTDAAVAMVKSVSRLLQTFSSSANVLVYCLASSSFRRSFRLQCLYLFCRSKWRRRRQQELERMQLSSRRASQFESSVAARDQHNKGMREVVCAPVRVVLATTDHGIDVVLPPLETQM